MLTVKMSAGVTPQVNLRDPLHIGDEEHKRGTTPTVKHRPAVRGISGLTNMADRIEICLKNLHR